MHPHRKATLIARLPMSLKGNVSFDVNPTKGDLNSTPIIDSDSKLIVHLLKPSQQNTNTPSSKVDNPTCHTLVQILSASESTKTCNMAPRCVSLGESTIQKTRFKPKKDVRFVDKSNSTSPRVLRSRTKAIAIARAMAVSKDKV
ncbi:hypothetical protein PHYBLDRAFT_163197 [Phycomyces blakesleeanus NRRL 1555(-)]|uniref:Uncharacterized protein n=1 Tax=Phycomyces blakesleeanus (strain ATCC 8743b / DSM 1359 / FGSC 10004 / NBRC 33097 / NRRL 1555) TaxID=763407 RepID=A0A167QRR6_PHYB8|nr:hypothetical protein PHYBLDRAFT_163197 [Phycomyces blakesleeanus NRRL 1555(-)]OAD80158.1 hypothetical protein PHYBLDRAFT_163197 [Phycomyces blakesleeanus NRRL 1555(-)]|eukprot:XP_018298198.1 hypothetical protein PHYBLDRAFT_163197 [Phycomyces blakesleeanus NRRL 1555(-)]